MAHGLSKKPRYIGLRILNRAGTKTQLSTVESFHFNAKHKTMHFVQLLLAMGVLGCASAIDHFDVRVVVKSGSYDRLLVDRNSVNVVDELLSTSSRGANSFFLNYKTNNGRLEFRTEIGGSTNTYLLDASPIEMEFSFDDAVNAWGSVALERDGSTMSIGRTKIEDGGHAHLHKSYINAAGYVQGEWPSNALGQLVNVVLNDEGSSGQCSMSCELVSNSGANYDAVSLGVASCSTVSLFAKDNGVSAGDSVHYYISYQDTTFSGASECGSISSHGGVDMDIDYTSYASSTQVLTLFHVHSTTLWQGAVLNMTSSDQVCGETVNVFGTLYQAYAC